MGSVPLWILGFPLYGRCSQWHSPQGLPAPRRHSHRPPLAAPSTSGVSPCAALVGGGCVGDDVDVCELDEMAGVVCPVFGQERMFVVKNRLVGGKRKRAAARSDCEVRVPK